MQDARLDSAESRRCISLSRELESLQEQVRAFLMDGGILFFLTIKRPKVDELRRRNGVLATATTAKSLDRRGVLEALLHDISKKQAILDELQVRQTKLVGFGSPKGQFQMQHVLPGEHEQEMRRLRDELHDLDVRYPTKERLRLERVCQVSE